MTNELFKEKVRILRPGKYEKLVGAIPKFENKIKFKMLLFTGLRYSEARLLYENPKWHINNAIKIPSTKTKAVEKERYVKLNSRGDELVSTFLNLKRNLPHNVNWDENLHRWVIKANLSPEGISAKTTRKTWESWLVTSYPNSFIHIYLSQGHTGNVSLNFYLNLNFTTEEKEQIKQYTVGWI